MATSITGMVTTSFPRGPDDPSGRFVLGMARALVRRGQRVEVVVPQPAGNHSWGDSGWLEGIRVFPAPYARPAFAQRLFFGAGAPENLAAAPWLACLVPFAVAALGAIALWRARRWDRVISHWLVPSSLVTGLALRRAIPHLGIAHSGDVHLLRRSRAGPLICRAVLERADTVGFVSRQLMEEFAGIVGGRLDAAGKDRMTVIPMGVDPEELVSTRDRLVVRRELGISGFAVMFLGRLVPIKGVDVLIRAAALTKGVQLLIVGAGPLREELERMARDLGVRAVFTGAVGPRRRAHLMAACDALAAPSRVLGDGRHEGLPTVLLEAMTAGLPVIASETGGVTDLVEDGVTGLLVPAEDPDALSGAIDRLARDSRLGRSLSAQAGELAASRTWDRICEALVFNGGSR